MQSQRDQGQPQSIFGTKSKTDSGDNNHQSIFNNGGESRVMVQAGVQHVNGHIFNINSGRAAAKKKEEVNYNVPLSFPFPRNRNFTGRDAELEAIDGYFSESTGSGVSIYAIIGTGGMGKTQIALEYGYTRYEKTQFTAVFWISAMTEETIQTSLVNIMQQIVDKKAREYLPNPPSYTSIAANLKISQMMDGNGRISSGSDAGAIKYAFFSWLKLSGNDKWLLIFDNADDLNVPIDDYFPNEAGHILITSRRPEFSDYGEQMEIGGLDRENALRLLLCLARRNATESDIESATEIIEKVGFMPLAITHAGCFIRQLNIPICHYLQYYERTFKEAQSRKSRIGWAYRKDTSMTTWEVSFLEVEKQNKEAASILLTCGYLNPAEISEDYWQDKQQLNTKSQTQEKNKFSILASYSLISRGQPGTFSVHPVVHSWARERGDDSDRLRAIGNALRIFGRKLRTRGRPDWSQRDGQEERRISAHIDVFLKHSEHYSFNEIFEKNDDISIGDVLGAFNKIALRMSVVGKFSEATKIYRKTLVCYGKAFGERHIDTLNTASSLAGCLASEGRYDEALPELQKTLISKNMALGEDHLSTNETKCQIADCLRMGGKLDEALTIYQEVLDFQERKSGKNDLVTIEIAHRIATTFYKQNRFDEALEAYQQVLISFKKFLSEDHPFILATLNNMAIVLVDQSKFDEGLKIYQECIIAHEKSLGKDHPSTLATVCNMGRGFFRQGRLDEALKLYQECIIAKERALGEDHPWVLDTVEGMAEIFFCQGQYCKALEHYQRLLVGRKRILSEDDPKILKTIHKIGTTLYRQGKLDEALQQLHIAAVGKERVLGRDHPSTLSTLRNIALISRKIAKKSPPCI
ncbi:hypothetical protein AOL_s00081g220 [Orbilia oligospora ATCC 24927]|uniref:Uncharacterized protein n=1 Tax=Arthrobotrys oligospora (strain ATCC 24927 / CBS 115.81 / DSM 1491) TaxID=756982 RepID=G1XFS7_ARTOA|nr:hypothetical protein AOL_s00081g220 [Orbilia oligospora ATCC 24927]EGX47893.1 hypothetical protein AOL_s00081g220 [Orbilia oligospora ATCC 24927]